MEENQSTSAEVLDPLVVEEEVQAIEAMHMELERLYVTYNSRARYYCKLEQVNDEKDCVHIMAYYAQTGEWKSVKVPMTYRMKVLNEENQAKAMAEIAKTTKDTREIFAKMSGHKEKPAGEGRSPGVSSGLGMLACWGKFFKEFAHQEGQREKIRAAMKAEFPNKHESVDRWLDAYRNYYNKGRLPGVTVPEIEISKDEWMK